MVALSLVYLTRLIGVSLVLAAVLYVAIDGTGKPVARARTALLLAGFAVIPLSLWLLYSWSVSSGAGIPYVRYYSGSLEPVMSAASGIDAVRVLFVKVRASLYDYGVHVGRLIVYWLPSSLVGAVFALLLTAVVVAGFLRCVLRRRTVVEYYVCLYVCALLVFPGSRQQRYMVPLIPFFWFFFLTALDAALACCAPAFAATPV